MGSKYIPVVGHLSLNNNLRIQGQFFCVQGGGEGQTHVQNKLHFVKAYGKGIKKTNNSSKGRGGEGFKGVSDNAKMKKNCMIGTARHP